MNSLETAWRSLGRYKKSGFPADYPDNVRRLYSPVDRPHEALVRCVSSAQLSLASAMFGWDDKEINELFLKALKDEHLPVQLSLDSTQAAGKGEVPLLKEWSGPIGNSLSIGHSIKGAITHLKTFVIDGILTVGGSMNLSHGGQYDQDNEMFFVWDPVFAAETRARLDAIHDAQLMQMAKHKQKLIVDYAAKGSDLTSEQRHQLEAGVIPH